MWTRSCQTKKMGVEKFVKRTRLAALSFYSGSLGGGGGGK